MAAGRVHSCIRMRALGPVFYLSLLPTCSFASLLSPSVTGPPKYFVAHWRGGLFSELADAVSQRLAMTQPQQAGVAGGEVCVWVDVLCSSPGPLASGAQQALPTVGAYALLE